MASNHYLNSQGQQQHQQQQQSNQYSSGHPFSSAAHNFTSQPSYMSSIGLIPGLNGSDQQTTYPSQGHAMHQARHHPGMGLTNVSGVGGGSSGYAGSTGLSGVMGMPSVLPSSSSQHSSARPTIVKRSRNNRSRPASRAASAIESGASSVMYATHDAGVANAAAVNSHQSNALHTNRYLQQFTQQTGQLSQHHPQHHQVSHQPLEHQNFNIGQQHAQQNQHQTLLQGHHPLSQVQLQDQQHQITPRHSVGLQLSQHQLESHQDHHGALHPSQASSQIMHQSRSHQMARHLAQSQPNMMNAVAPIVPTGPIFECDGIQFKLVEELADVKVKRLKSEKIKPIEELTFDDIKAYNRNQLRAYCFVYGIKRKKKAEMEQNMARYAAMFHPGDPSFDLSKFVPTDYLPGPIPRRKVPVTKEQKALSAGKFAQRLMSTVARPNTAVQPAFSAPPAPNPSHYGLSQAHQQMQQLQQLEAQQQQQAQHMSGQYLHQPKLPFNSRSSHHDPLAGFHGGSGMMVPQHLLSDLGDE